jgi:DNA mismatch endonuclease Vsr
MNRHSEACPPIVLQPQQADDGQLSWASSPAVRRNMQANRGRDTGPELRLRRLLHAAGRRYRVEWPMPGDRRRRIDIAFPRRKIAVFVDGCFWHRCPNHYVSPKANAEFWDTKSAATPTVMPGLRPSSPQRAGWCCASGSTRTLRKWQSASVWFYRMFHGIPSAYFTV